MVKITADSVSDIPFRFLKALDIEIIPIEVFFGNELFHNTMEDGHREFMDKLKNSRFFPRTAQPSPYRYREFFLEALASGEDVLFFSVSSAFSGCYTTACLVAEEIGDSRLHIIDSKSASIGIGLQVIKAAQMAREGRSVEEILQVVSVMQKNIISYVVVNTVEFLHKGGRIHLSEKLLAEILNIKPIISISSDGTAQAIHKVRGFKKGLQYIVSQVAAISRDYTNELLAFGFSGDEAIKGVLENLLRKEVKLGRTFDFTPGPCMAAHVGPGATAVFFCRPGILDYLNQTSKKKECDHERSID